MNLSSIFHTKRALAIIVAAACIIGIDSSGCTTARSYNSEASANTILRNIRAININTSSVTELEKIPHIGIGLASKIVEHRERYGPFQKIEYLMLVDGISDERFREIKDLVTIE